MKQNLISVTVLINPMKLWALIFLDSVKWRLIDFQKFYKAENDIEYTINRNLNLKYIIDKIKRRFID